MDIQTQQQVDELAVLRNEHEKRLRALVRQAAYLGRSTPPEILVEIEEIEAKVGAITASITKLYIAESRHMEREVRADAADGLPDISRQLSDLADATRRELAGVYELLLSWQDTDSLRRRRREWRNDVFFLSIIGLLIMVVIVLSVR